MTLKTRLTIVFFLLIAIPVTLIATVAFSNTTNALTRQAAQQLISLASTRETEIEIFVESQINIYKAISSRTKLRNTLAHYKNAPTEDDISVMRTILADAKEPFEDVVWIDILALDGAPVVSTELEQVQRDSKIQDFVSQSTYKTTIFFDQTSEFFIVMGPIVRDGELLGILAFEATNEALENIITNYEGLGMTGEMLFAQRDSNGDASFLHTRRFEDHEAALATIDKTFLHIPMTQALLKKEDIFFDVIDYRGEPVIAATRYINDHDWGIVLKIDKGELLQTVKDFQATLIIFVFIIVVLTALISYAIARSLTRPIEVLQNNVSMISDGEFSITIPSDVLAMKDELGVLANAFQTISKRLSELYVDLEKKVITRTNALNEKIKELEQLNSVMLDREEKMIALKKEIRRHKDSS